MMDAGCARIDTPPGTGCNSRNNNNSHYQQ
jgi:hypothetical protein